MGVNIIQTFIITEERNISRGQLTRCVNYTNSWQSCPMSRDNKDTHTHAQRHTQRREEIMQTCTQAKMVKIWQGSTWPVQTLTHTFFSLWVCIKHAYTHTYSTYYRAVCPSTTWYVLIGISVKEIRAIGVANSSVWHRYIRARDWWRQLGRMHICFSQEVVSLLFWKWK